MMAVGVEKCSKSGVCSRMCSDLGVKPQGRPAELAGIDLALGLARCTLLDSSMTTTLPATIMVARVVVLGQGRLGSGSVGG